MPGMRKVKPIETGFADDRFATTFVDRIAPDIDLEAASGIADSTVEVVEKYFERRIDEIDALLSLLGMARKLDTSGDRFGYDVEYLDQIVLRRVRKLTRACQETVSNIMNYDPENPPVAEDFGP